MEAIGDIQETYNIWSWLLPLISGAIGALIGTYGGSYFLHWKQEKKIKNVRAMAVKALNVFRAYAKKSYIEKNPELIQKFTNAIQKGLDYVNSHSAWEIAKTIQPQFKDTPVEKIATIVDRYKSQDTWKENTVFEKDSFELLENILEESGELKKRVPYEKLVRTDFSINAVNAVQK